jgi:hypothetical protein
VHVSIRVRLRRVGIRTRVDSSLQTDQEKRNETQYFRQYLHSNARFVSIVWQRSEFGGPGQACADAHRRLFVR